MKRSNFVFGLSASGVLHAGLLYLLLVRLPAPQPAPASPPPAPTPVQIATAQPPRPQPAELSDPPPVVPTPMPLTERVAAPPPRTGPQPSQAPSSAGALAQAAPPPSHAPSHAAASPRSPARPQARPAPAATPVEPVESPPVETRQPAARSTPDEAVSRVDDEAQQGHPGSSAGDSDYVPPLRVHWSDADELIDVARSLGMRLFAVDGSGGIIGEITLTGQPQLGEWGGPPAGYSNRVRMLSPSIFEGTIDTSRIREVWVFVPASYDRAMISAQRSAVLRRGGRLEDVTHVDGHFVRAATGAWRLEITDIRWREGRDPGRG